MWEPWVIVWWVASVGVGADDPSSFWILNGRLQLGKCLHPDERPCASYNWTSDDKDELEVKCRKWDKLELAEKDTWTIAVAPLNILSRPQEADLDENTTWYEVQPTQTNKAAVGPDKEFIHNSFVLDSIVYRGGIGMDVWLACSYKKIGNGVEAIVPFEPFRVCQISPITLTESEPCWMRNEKNRDLFSPYYAPINESLFPPKLCHSALWIKLGNESASLHIYPEVRKWVEILVMEHANKSNLMCAEKESWCWERKSFYNVTYKQEIYQIELYVSGCPGLLSLMPSWLMAPSGLSAYQPPCAGLNTGEHLDRKLALPDQYLSDLVLEDASLILTPVNGSRIFCSRLGPTIPRLEEYHGVLWGFIFVFSLVFIAIPLCYHARHRNSVTELQISLSDCSRLLRKYAVPDERIWDIGKAREVEDIEEDLMQARQELENHPIAESYDFFGWPRHVGPRHTVAALRLQLRSALLRLITPILAWAQGRPPKIRIPSPPMESVPVGGIRLKRYFRPAYLVHLGLRRYAYADDADSENVDTLADVRDSHIFGHLPESPVSRTRTLTKTKTKPTTLTPQFSTPYAPTTDNRHTTAPSTTNPNRHTTAASTTSPDQKTVFHRRTAPLRVALPH